MIKIVGKFLVELKSQVAGKGIEISITDPAIDLLVKKGFNRKMGARPLQRVIDNDIKKDLSKLILFGELKNGGLLTIDAQDDNIILNVKEPVLEQI